MVSVESTFKYIICSNILDTCNESGLFFTQFNPPRGKGGLVNIVQHFCTSTEFQWHNLIG